MLSVIPLGSVLMAVDSLRVSVTVSDDILALLRLIPVRGLLRVSPLRDVEAARFSEYLSCSVSSRPLLLLSKASRETNRGVAPSVELSRPVF